VITYVVEQWQDTDPRVAAWSRERFETPLTARTAEAGFPMSPYCAFRVEHEPKSGLQSFASTPRFSTGYVALRNRPALLIEAHMLKDYATRVRGTLATLQNAIAIVGEESRALRELLADVDARTASPAFRDAPLPLALETSFDDSVMIDFLGVNYDVVTSEITGGTWHRYGTQRETWRVPYFRRQKVAADAPLPAAYVIPQQWTEVIARLDAHGIRYARIERTTRVHVSTVRFHDTTWQERPYEGRHPLTYQWDEIEEDRVLPAGTVVVETGQPLARVIANLLEPAAPDALVRWGFFDASFEYKEYIESYVIESMIPEMLARDPSLAREFEAARKKPDFPADPEAIRRWFYRRTPYVESRVGVYPVARLMDRAVVDSLLAPPR